MTATTTRMRAALSISAIAVAGGLAASVAPFAARAQDRVIISAGGQLDYARSGYVGATVILPWGDERRNFAVRGAVFGGDYTYTANQDVRVKGDFTGAELDGVFHFAGDQFWTDTALGVRWVDTHLSPNDPSNRRRGSKAELAITSDGGKVAGPWRVDWLASYGTDLDDYAARIGLTHRASDTWRAGLEASFEGDPTYDLQRVGPMAAVRFGDRSELQFSAGVSKQSDRSAGAYFRTSFYRSF